MTENIKNMNKRDSYAFAFFRINQAIDNKFPLEAITMEESIISDRLRAYSEANNLPLKDKRGNLCSLYAFIDNVEQFLGDNNSDFKDLLKQINKWRKGRNMLLHGVVKTELSGKSPEISYSDFIPKAMQIAEDGKKISKKYFYNDKQI